MYCVLAAEAASAYSVWVDVALLAVYCPRARQLLRAWCIYKREVVYPDVLQCLHCAVVGIAHVSIHWISN